MLRIKVDISKSNDGHAEIEYDSYRKDYEIIVHATHDTDLQEFFSDRKKLASMIAETSERQFDEFASTGLDLDDFYFDVIARKQISEVEIEKMLDDQFLFMFFGSEISKFIDENIDLLNEHNVLLPAGDRGIALDRKALDSKLSEYPNIRNPYILLEGNASGVVVEAARDTIDYIDGITEHVKSLKLSPLEEIIYVK